MPIPIESPKPRVTEQTWGQEILLAEAPGYTLKLLRYKAGRAGGLQMHTTKDEAFYLHEGEAWVDYASGPADMLIARRAVAGDCFRVPPGAVHRFTAETDCTVFEASTNVENDRVRMERWYGQPEVGGLPSTAPEPVRP